MPRPDVRADSSLRWGTSLMIAGAVVITAYGVSIFVSNFTRFLETGLGPEQVGKNEAQIKAFSPELHHYISHLHIGVGSLLATTGLFVIALTWFGVRKYQLWALATAAAIATLALAVNLPAHYPWNFDTAWHLGPPYVASGSFFAGALLALRALLSARR